MWLVRPARCCGDRHRVLGCRGPGRIGRQTRRRALGGDVGRCPAADGGVQPASGSRARRLHAPTGRARLHRREDAAGAVLERVRRTALALQSARIARSTGNGAIHPPTDRPLTFSGRTSVSIPEGALAVSDPLDFDLAPLSQVALTVSLRNVPAEVTGHPGSRTTSYLRAGDVAPAPDLSGAVRVDHWYYVNGIDVLADGSTAPSPSSAIRSRTAGARRRTATTAGPTTWRRRLRREPRNGQGRGRQPRRSAATACCGTASGRTRSPASTATCSRCPACAG